MYLRMYCFLIGSTGERIHIQPNIQYQSIFKLWNNLTKKKNISYANFLILSFFARTFCSIIRVNNKHIKLNSFFLTFHKAVYILYSTAWRWQWVASSREGFSPQFVSKAREKKNETFHGSKLLVPNLIISQFSASLCPRSLVHFDIEWL